MDTGSYMANQMDDMITVGLHERDEFETKLWADVEAYIKEQGYTWKMEDIVFHYIERFTQGFYVSYTCKDVIVKFEDRLKKLYHPTAR